MMLVVKIELWSAISGQRKVLGETIIYNTGESDDPGRGNYTARVLRKGVRAEELVASPTPAQVTRTGHVEDYPRLSYNVWRLVIRALLSAFPEEIAYACKTELNRK